MLTDTLSIMGPVMTLQSDSTKGLEIKWNFTGMMSPTNFETYHLFIIWKSSLKEANNFLEIYYSNLKSGDIIGLYEGNSKDKLQEKIKWSEKTAFSLDDRFLNNHHILKNYESDVISEIPRLFEKKKGLVFVNLLLGDEAEDDPFPREKASISFQEKIHSLRSSNPASDKIIFNIIHPTKDLNTMNCISGTNLLYYSNSSQETFSHQQAFPENKVSIRKSIENVCHHISKLRKSVVLRTMRARVYILGHQYFSNTNSEWAYLEDEECLEKIYYGVPACEFKETFMFLVKGMPINAKIDLKLVLDCQFYDGSKMQAKNNISFVTDPTDLMCRTYTNDNFNQFAFANVVGMGEIATDLVKKTNYIWVFQTKN